MPDQVKDTDAQIKADQEKAKLDDYKAQLLKVHEQLKPQAELFNALKERGIDSVEGLTQALAKNKVEEKSDDTSVTMPEEPSNESSDRVSQLEELVRKQGQMIQNQQAQMQTSKLMGQIQAEIKDKPEYALLSKGLNEQMAYNILRAKENDRQNGLNKDLSHYLQSTEKELRGFFEKLGGELKTEGESQSGETNLVAPQKKEDSSEKSLIDFPTLPGGGGGETPKSNPAEAIQKLGTNPLTKKYDDSVAFEKFLTKSMEEGKI